MFEFGAVSQALGNALAVSLALAVLTWVVSIPLRNVSIVDSVWSLLIAGAAYSYVWPAGVAGARGTLALTLMTIWAVRLAFYITVRNHGHGEDRRYREIRARNEPGFAFKSLYLVFALQAGLALVVSLPLLPAVRSVQPLQMTDALGALLWLFGFAWEAVGDWQLARFKSVAANHGRVMDQGLWRYSRHPNYFGECCQWWGLFLIALGLGAWWTVLSPLLMTVLLLKVSGVTLLERDIGERRPGYRQYVARTNAFFPWVPR